MSNEYDFLFKLLLIGDSGVGKVRIPNEWWKSAADAY